jgi:hypothetical protein
LSDWPSIRAGAKKMHKSAPAASKSFSGRSSSGRHLFLPCPYPTGVDNPRVKSVCLILLATVACAEDPIRIEGPTNHLPMATNLQSFEVFHASKANGLGYTYNHHVDMACWKGRLYVAWSSAERDEDTWPWHELYSTSPDGRTWSEPAEQFPQGTSTPLRMYFFHAPNGRMLALAGKYKGQTKLKEDDKTELVIREILPNHTLGPIGATNDAGFVEACRQLYENRTFLKQQDHGTLLGDKRISWHDQKQKDMDLQALMFFHRRDGALVGIAKKRLVIVSTDEGRTWSPPVKPATLITGRAKVWGQRTPEGQYILVYNPDPTNRYPLVMVQGDDGITFRDMRIVNGELRPKRYEARTRTSARSTSAASPNGQRTAHEMIPASGLLTA